MTQLISALPFLLAGIACITLIDTVGAYASRRYNFNYGYLAVVSFIVYGYLGAVVSEALGLTIALLVNLVVGFYDATIGWNLSMKLGANTGLNEDELKERTPASNVAIMLAVALAFTYIGYLVNKG